MMVGAIFRQELMVGSRRTRSHVFRWIYAAWLISFVVWLLILFQIEEVNVAMARRMTRGDATDHHASAPQVVGNRFATSFIWQQWVLLFLGTPIFAAGAIVDEKRQGTLAYLLLSEVEARQLLVGKLLGRVAHVALWLMAGLPLFALMAGFGGIEPYALGFLLLGLMMPTMAVTALSLLASTYCRQTRDAVLVVYFSLVAGWVGVSSLGGPLRLSRSPLGAATGLGRGRRCRSAGGVETTGRLGVVLGNHRHGRHRRRQCSTAAAVSSRTGGRRPTPTVVRRGSRTA